ncbi:MAG: nucleotidyltransferase domain-containing protein [Candidatus Paceibacterota bacterium]|jgi:predicted nucleotidyltransferase
MIDTELLRKTIAEIAPQYDLQAAILFGSQARGDANRLSDIDIGIAVKSELSTIEVGQIAAAISQKMAIDVEVAQLAQMSPIYQRGAIEDGILLYEREPGWFDRFAVYVYDLYWESKKLLALRRQYLQTL